MRVIWAALTERTDLKAARTRHARERCHDLVRNSVGLVTALGDEAYSVLEKGLLTEAEIDSLPELEAMTRPEARHALRVDDGEGRRPDVATGLADVRSRGVK